GGGEDQRERSDEQHQHREHGESGAQLDAHQGAHVGVAAGGLLVDLGARAVVAEGTARAAGRSGDDHAALGGVLGHGVVLLYPAVRRISWSRSARACRLLTWSSSVPISTLTVPASSRSSPMWPRATRWRRWMRTKPRERQRSSRVDSGIRTRWLPRAVCSRA